MNLWRGREAGLAASFISKLRFPIRLREEDAEVMGRGHVLYCKRQGRLEGRTGRAGGRPGSEEWNRQGRDEALCLRRRSCRPFSAIAESARHAVPPLPRRSGPCCLCKKPWQRSALVVENQVNISFTGSCAHFGPVKILVMPHGEVSRSWTFGCA